MSLGVTASVLRFASVSQSKEMRTGANKMNAAKLCGGGMRFESSSQQCDVAEAAFSSRVLFTKRSDPCPIRHFRDNDQTHILTIQGAPHNKSLEEGQRALAIPAPNLRTKNQKSVPLSLAWRSGVSTAQRGCLTHPYCTPPRCARASMRRAAPAIFARHLHRDTSLQGR